MVEDDSTGSHVSRAVLRIHGIGKHDVTRVIGCADPIADTAHLYQSRSDPTLFAVSWSSLTRTGFAILSFFLFPFALLNAAGFMTWTASRRTDTFNGSLALKLANISVSAVWVMWGLLLFWDVAAAARWPNLTYAWRGVGVMLGLFVIARVLIDLSPSSRRLQGSPTAQALQTWPRYWIGHYLGVAFLVWLGLGQTRIGLSGLYELVWWQLMIGAPIFWCTRTIHAQSGKANGLLSTDAALFAYLLSHLWGYSLVQAASMLLSVELRRRDTYLPAGLVAGFKDDRIDNVFFITAVAAVALVAVGGAGVIVRYVGRRALAGWWRTGQSQNVQAFEARFYRRLQRLKQLVRRPAPRPKLSWVLAALLTFWAAAPTILYARRIGTVPPWLWTLNWRLISVGFAIVSIVLLATVVTRMIFRSSYFATAFDVLSFLPRQFHPWSPPSYGDAAIRDVHQAIRRLAASHDLVWVVGHSQGSVIAYASLLTLDVETAARCRLITCGSPLMRLYGYFFPAWFTPARVAELSKRLSRDERGISWWNFYRCTDPIASPLGLPTDLVRDVPLHEPEVERGLYRPNLLGHSDYWDDPKLITVLNGGNIPVAAGSRCCQGAVADAASLPAPA